MATRKPNRIAAARAAQSGTKTGADKPETVTLAEIAANPALLTSLTALLGSPATESDANDAATVTLAEVRGRLADVGKSLVALSRTLTADEVRVSSKNGTSVYAYAVCKPESGSVSVGLTISDALGAALAKHATRR